MSNSKLFHYENKEYYNADGVFNQEKAIQAYHELMKYHGYPIVDRLKGEEFWAIDFGLGRFTEVGMAGIFWVNSADGYLGHEIYLLPGQRIPEHGHNQTDSVCAKMEAWQCRYGSVSLYSEGIPTPGAEDDIPQVEKQYWIAKTKTDLKPGEVGQLKEAGSMHWMMGGPKGAIVTEYGTFHDNDGLVFSTPGIVF